MVLPNLVASILPVDKSTGVGTLIYNVVEGVVRVGIFIGYLALTSLMKDIRRVWQYHGAEHKTIHCYENEEELTVENVKKYSTRHPAAELPFVYDYGGKHIGVLAGGTARTVDKHTA